MCLPCCPGPKQIASTLGLDVKAENDIADFCKKLCEIFQNAMRQSESGVALSIQQSFSTCNENADKAAKIICRAVPHAVAQMNPCLIAQLIVQVIGLLLGSGAGIRAQELLDENRQKIVELISKVISQLLVDMFCQGFELPGGPSGPGKPSEGDHKPDDSPRC